MDQNSHLTEISKDICQVLDCVTIRCKLRHAIDCCTIESYSPVERIDTTEAWQEKIYQDHRRCFVNEIISSLNNVHSSTSVESSSTLKNQVYDLEMNVYRTATNFEDYFQGLVERVYSVRLDCNKQRSKSVSSPLESNSIASDHEDLNKLIKYQNSLNSNVELKITFDNTFVDELSDEAKPFHPPVSVSHDLCEKLVPIFQTISDRKHSFWIHHSAARKDMSTFLNKIFKKLKQKKYKTPIEFIQDMRRIFVKVWIYYLKGASFYQHSNELLNEFDMRMDPIVKEYGYCCAREYVFLPRTIFCSKKDCPISPYAYYYVYSNPNSSPTSASSDKCILCKKCFNSNQSGYILIDNEQSKTSVKTPKLAFDLVQNGHTKEAMIDCTVCSRRFHNICVLYHEHIWPEGYVCKKCEAQCPTNSRKVHYSARDLPTNKLSDALEKRVDTFLRKECDNDTGRVTIRVLAASDRICEIKPRFKKHFGSQVPDGYPYRTKAIFAFQEIEGVDVVLFGMHVQEYDSRCPGPNAKRVYISYLDSVHYFRPKQKRTALYYEILIGYLDYVKQLGFVYAHIWACPPSEGDDYIFNCHPVEQRIPEAKQLQAWYKTMLDIAVQQHVVVDYKDIIAHCHENHIDRMADVPYFDGDYWTRQMEDLLDKHELLPLSNDIYTDGTDEPEDSIEKNSKKRKRRYDTSTTKKNSNLIDNQPLLTRKRRCSETNPMEELKIQMTQEKESFFIVRLRRSKADSFIKDPDPIIRCNFMESRESFLNFARNRHCEFSSIRRTKYSTMIFMTEIMTLSSIENDVQCTKILKPQCLDCRQYLSRIGNHLKTCTAENCSLPYCVFLKTQLQRPCTVTLERISVIS